MELDRVRSPSLRGLDDPRAVEILATEHWSLAATRTLGCTEMVGRATMFIAILSAIVVALALVAQATQFGRTTLELALPLLAVALFVGVMTFARSLVLSFEDARCVAGMNLLRHGYLELIPELQPYFVTGHDGAERGGLEHGASQRPRNLIASLTTIAGVVAALNSSLVGTIAADVAALLGAPAPVFATIGVVASVGSAALHVHYAARFRAVHGERADLTTRARPTRISGATARDA
jgi:uncharacterized membrane protein YuzA (DUF378 family)